MELWTFTKEIFAEFNKDRCLGLGAALAYYTVFALAPIIILVMMVAGVFVGEATIQGEIYSQIKELVGKEGAAQIRTMVEAVRQPDLGSLATLVSTLSLVFAATGVFYSIKRALNTIWKVKAMPKSGVAKFAVDRLLSLAIVLSIGFILLVSLVINGLVAGLANVLSNTFPEITLYLVKVINFVASTAVSALLFAIIFKTLPDAKNEWSDVWIGSVVTALLFALGKTVIGLYIQNTDMGSTYGAAGAIVVILVWVYYAAQILFLGAEFTFVYARRYGSGILPSAHAVRVVRREVEVDDNGRTRKLKN
jgi:membrane protein